MGKARKLLQLNSLKLQDLEDNKIQLTEMKIQIN